MSLDGQFNMRKLIEQAESMQQRVAEVRAGLESVEVTGTADGGAVTVTVTALGDFTSVTIDPKVVDPGDVRRLEALMLVALRDVNAQLRDVAQRRMAGLTANLETGSPF